MFSKLIKLTVLTALMMILMGTALHAQIITVPIQIERRHNPPFCYYGGLASGEFLVEAFYVTPGGDILFDSFYVYNGIGATQYSLPVANALGATEILICVTPSTGVGGTKCHYLYPGSSQIPPFVFPLLPGGPNTSHICR